MTYNRYQNSLQLNDVDGTWFSPQQYFIDISEHHEDINYTVKQGDRLDVLAYRYYEDPFLWWVISEYNDKFWILDLTVGEVIRIPSYEHLFMDLLI